jgi:hypothetical protein
MEAIFVGNLADITEILDERMNKIYKANVEPIEEQDEELEELPLAK